NQQLSGSTMAWATRYAVSTHVASSTLADMLPAMCGSATLATLVSSTSMNVASMTVPAMNHGLIAVPPTPLRGFGVAGTLWGNVMVASTMTSYLRKMVASTFMPGRKTTPDGA